MYKHLFLVSSFSLYIGVILTNTCIRANIIFSSMIFSDMMWLPQFVSTVHIYIVV